MRVLSKDFIELNQLKEFVANGHSVKVEDLTKEKVGQSLLNNKFMHDFDFDGEITYKDYMIAWNWVMQGKPDDIFDFIDNKGPTPKLRKMPYQYVQDNDLNVLPDNRIPFYDETDTEESVKELGMSSVTGMDHVISACAGEPSADWNRDGEVDEDDLAILERYILIRPETVEEYNLNRGSYPITHCLPDMLTGKFSCDHSYYYGDIDQSGGSVIEDADVEKFMAILSGIIELPNEESLAFILSNVFQKGFGEYTGPGFKEVLFTCNLRDGITDKTQHTTYLNRIDYRDYLIMKEWLRLGKPDPAHHLSDYYALAWFNTNAQEGTPTACKLPFEYYYTELGGEASFEAVYVGEENL